MVEFYEQVAVSRLKLPIHGIRFEIHDVGKGLAQDRFHDLEVGEKLEERNPVGFPLPSQYGEQPIEVGIGFVLANIVHRILLCI